MKAALFEQLRADRTAKRPVVLVTTVPSGEQRLVYPNDAAPADLSPTLAAAVQRAAASDEATTIDEAGALVFVQPFNPPLRLIIVGAVHIAQPLARLAAVTGFAVVVVDPRAAFLTESRFADVERASEWPDKVVAALRPDSRTAVVTLTHDPKLDDPALYEALRSRAFYVGCLGGSKNHATRLERLRERGLDDGQLARLHGPVGLRIHARSPAEIAVSIVAQMVEQLRKPRAT